MVQKSAQKYVPPRQGKFGQVVDVIVLLALIVFALYFPLWLGLAGGSKMPLEHNPQATWADLGQDTPEKIAAYNALGYSDPTDADLQTLITARYDYWAFSRWELFLMIIVVIGYYVLVVRFSGKEYREVISEKFGDRT